MKIGEMDVVLVRGSCRERLCHEDFRFIASRLGVSGGHADVQDLLNDPDSRDLLLDDPALFGLVQQGIASLEISSNLYFYVTLRNVLKEMGLDSRAVSDYLADLLSTFLYSSGGMQNRLRETPFRYLCSLMRHLDRVEGMERFCTGVHIGNYAMIVGGIFPERLILDKEDGLDAKLAFIETVGSVNYNLASRGEYASRHEIKEVLQVLGRQFRLLRVGLNRVAEFAWFASTEPYVENTSFVQ